MVKFYDDTNFRNTIYSLDESLRTYFANLLFSGDLNRIIYSSNGYALRERASKIGSSSLDFPFMNMKVMAIAQNSERNWYNNVLNSKGVYIEPLKRKLRATPINVQYDMTMFLSRDDDLQIAYYKMTWENTNETKLNYTINFDGIDVNMLGVIYYNLEYNNQYTEQDWLERNKVYTIEINISVDTWYLQDNADISIPESIELDFGTINPDSATKTIPEEGSDIIPTVTETQFDESQFD